MTNIIDWKHWILDEGYKENEELGISDFDVQVEFIKNRYIVTQNGWQVVLYDFVDVIDILYNITFEGLKLYPHKKENDL